MATPQIHMINPTNPFNTLKIKTITIPFKQKFIKNNTMIPKLTYNLKKQKTQNQKN